MIADTSAAALGLLGPDERQTTMDRVLFEINEEPLTARGIAERLGINEHEAGRRLSDLVTYGYAEKGEAVKNEATGMPARLHTPTAEGRRYLRTGEKPRAPVKRADLVKAVILAARNVADPEGELVEALRVLDAHDRGKAQHRVPAPYGDPRRFKAIRDGFWMRSNGDVIMLRHMNVWHLSEAMRWMRRHGAQDDDAILVALVAEYERRYHA